MGMYHFFGLLWTNQLIQGVAIMVISGAFSKWYFAGPHDAEDDDRPEDYSERMSTPVLKSCCRTVRYHLGTVMFGGFIIAVVQFVRAALAYVEENTKTWQEKNKLLKCAFKLIGCILYCFEKCVKYVSKMAYITTAISGTSFCVSAYRSIQLFQRESSLISIVYMISQFILTLSKVLISLTSGCLAYLWLTYGFPEGEGVSNAAFPLLLSMIFGYFVAEAVLDVYTTGIDTILLCYSLDKENNAENGNLKAGSSLRKFIAQNKTKKKKQLVVKRKKMIKMTCLMLNLLLLHLKQVVTVEVQLSVFKYFHTKFLFPFIAIIPCFFFFNQNYTVKKKKISNLLSHSFFPSSNN